MPNGCPKGVTSRFCIVHLCESCSVAAMRLILSMKSIVRLGRGESEAAREGRQNLGGNWYSLGIQSRSKINRYLFSGTQKKREEGE